MWPPWHRVPDTFKEVCPLKSILVLNRRRSSLGQTTSTSLSITSSSSMVNHCKHPRSPLSRWFLSVLACPPPVLTLIPSTSNLSYPLQFRRDQDFFLSSAIELNCNLSRTITIKWTIKNCSTSACLNSFPLDSPVISISSIDLYLPARTLPVGLYQLTLTVTLNIPSSPTSSKSAYVRVTPSGITANLVPFGTSMITSGLKQDLQFNPGLYSVDLDEDQFNGSVSEILSALQDTSMVRIDLELELSLLLSSVWSVEFP